MSEMTPFMGIVESISPPLMGHTHMDSLVVIIQWSRTLCLWNPFQTSGNASDIRDLFIHLGLAVLKKHLMGDYR